MKLALSFGLLCALGCADADQVPSSVPILSFRFECEADTPGALLQTLDGGMTGYFGPEEIFALASAGPSTDRRGGPAISFTIREGDAQRFADLTEQYVGKRLAVFVDHQLLTAPEINERLPGQGILSGGAGGFTQEARDSLIERLRAQIHTQ